VHARRTRNHRDDRDRHTPEETTAERIRHQDFRGQRPGIVVSVIAFVVFAASARVVERMVALALVPLGFARYYERRLKSTAQAHGPDS
jgi:hypothetical protein